MYSPESLSLPPITEQPGWLIKIAEGNIPNAIEKWWKLIPIDDVSEGISKAVEYPNRLDIAANACFVMALLDMLYQSPKPGIHNLHRDEYQSLRAIYEFMLTQNPSARFFDERYHSLTLENLPSFSLTAPSSVRMDSRAPTSSIDWPSFRPMAEASKDSSSSI
jgi:hypothetical protein